jgi:chorismate mutase
MELLTDVKVEQAVVERVRLKAATFGQEINPAAAAAASANSGAGSSSGAQQQSPGEQQRLKIRPDVLADMYDRMVMPLTKDVQVAYLLRRLDHEQ